MEGTLDLTLERSENEAIDSLQYAYECVVKLAQMRIENKMSANRVSGVGRELKELLKVMEKRT